MTRKNKKNKQEPGMQSGSIQHIVRGGDTVAVGLNQAPASTSLHPQTAPAGMNHGADRQLWQDLKRQSKDLKKQEKTVRDERKQLELEREAIAALASQKPSDPDIIRRSTLLRLRCEGMEIRDRTLARERFHVNSGFQSLQRNAPQRNQQPAAKKKGKGKGKQNVNEGMQHDAGSLSWENSWENGCFDDENKLMNSSGPPAGGIIAEPQPQLKLEGKIQEYHDQYSKPYEMMTGPTFTYPYNAPANQATTYNYTANASAMLADLGDNFSAHKGIHPQRLLNLATQEDNDYTPRGMSEEIPEPCGTSSNNVPVGQNSRFNFSSSLVAPRPANDDRDASNPNMSPLPEEIQGPGFSFSSKLVYVKPGNGYAPGQTSNSKPSHHANIQESSLELSHSLTETQIEDETNNIQSPKWTGLPPISIQGSEINTSIALMQPETVSENGTDRPPSPRPSSSTTFQPLGAIADTTLFPPNPENDLDKRHDLVTHLGELLPA